MEQSSETYKLHIEPVDLSQSVALPIPWPKLEAEGFHPDLLDRVRGFALQAHRRGFHTEADVALRWIGEGFVKSFDRSSFEPEDNDPDVEIKRQFLDAIQDLALEFGDRVSSVVWNTLAYMGTRPDPRKYATILSQIDALPLPYYIADSALHALGKVYGLKLHIDSRIFARTGMVVEHNCDCGGCIFPPETDGAVRGSIPKERHPLATAALLSHLLGESALIMVLKLPFEMGLSPEAAEIMAHELPATA